MFEFIKDNSFELACTAAVAVLVGVPITVFLFVLAPPSNAEALRAATANARSYAASVIGEAPASIACEPHFRGVSRDTECVLRFRNRPSVFVVCSVIGGELSSGCRLSQPMVQK
jgi:hypothetical protein